MVYPYLYIYYTAFVFFQRPSISMPSKYLWEVTYGEEDEVGDAEIASEVHFTLWYRREEEPDGTKYAFATRMPLSSIQVRPISYHS